MVQGVAQPLVSGEEGEGDSVPMAPGCCVMGGGSMGREEARHSQHTGC